MYDQFDDYTIDLSCNVCQEHCVALSLCDSCETYACDRHMAKKGHEDTGEREYRCSLCAQEPSRNMTLMYLCDLVSSD